LLRHCRLLTGRRAVMPVAGALWRCAESGVAVMTDTIPSTSSAGDATAPTTRQILQRAIGLHRAGELESAAHIYREVLAQHPQQAIALHYLGIVLHQQGQHEAGLAYVRQSCALQPDNASWHNELGNMLFALGQFEAANEAYLEALQADPRDHEVWNNLGSSQLQSEATAADAVFSFEQALLLAPDFVPALLHLGNIHEAAGDKMSSARYQCRAFVLPPLEGKSKEMLGISFYFLGRLPEAAQMYRDWMQAEPDNPIAAHMYAACSQVAVPQRASDQYIETHFDRYAETFNSNLLDSLAYRGPELMHQGLVQIATAAAQYDVLDVGCGTGLCVPVARPYARRLVGVDLSGKMLEQARLRGGYDELIKQEISAYLATRQCAFDIVLAADTMIYFGHLDEVLLAMYRAMRPGAYFIFTLESVDHTLTPGADFHLHASGRYRHTLDYVRRVLQQGGFVISSLNETVLREEMRQPVAGMQIIAQRPH
jgi:predicted TPR repeat methyltransferase